MLNKKKWFIYDPIRPSSQSSAFLAKGAETYDKDYTFEYVKHLPIEPNNHKSGVVVLWLYEEMVNLSQGGASVLEKLLNFRIIVSKKVLQQNLMTHLYNLFGNTSTETIEQVKPEIIERFTQTEETKPVKLKRVAFQG